MIRYFNVDKDTLPVFAALCEEDADERFTELSVALGAINDEDGEASPVGILTGHVIDNEIMLDRIYVDPEYRRKGIGRGMLLRLAEACEAMDETIRGIMAVISSEEEELQLFFKGLRIPMIPMDNVGQYRTTLDTLRMLPISKDSARVSVPLDSVTSTMLRRFEAQAEEQDADVGVPFPIDPGLYDKASRVIVRDGEIQGLILLKEEGEGYAVSWLMCLPQAHLQLSALIRDAVIAIRETDQRDLWDIPIVFGTLNEASLELGEHLFYEAEYESYNLAYLEV